MWKTGNTHRDEMDTIKRKICKWVQHLSSFMSTSFLRSPIYSKYTKQHISVVHIDNITESCNPKTRTRAKSIKQIKSMSTQFYVPSNLPLFTHKKKHCVHHLDKKQNRKWMKWTQQTNWNTSFSFLMSKTQIFKLK